MRKYKNASGGRLILETYDLLLQTWGVSFQEEDIDTTFGRTHLVMAGDPQAPPLLLFHGVGDDSAFMWRYNAYELARHFHVYAIDTIGGPGKSEPNQQYFAAFDPVIWLDDVLAAKKLNQVYLAGVSNGAYLVQRYIVNRPHNVIRAVCLAGGIAVKGHKGPMLKMMLLFLPEALFPSEKNMKKLVVKLTASPEKLISDPLNMRHWHALLKYFNNRYMMAHKPAGFTDAEIAVIKEKALFLIGSSDRLVYSSESLALLDQYQLNCRIIEGAGHAVNHEQPDVVHQEMLGHLLGHPAGLS